MFIRLKCTSVTKPKIIAPYSGTFCLENFSKNHTITYDT